MAVIGCDIPVHSVVGAEAIAAKSGVWIKTQFCQKGHFLCATVYMVSAGEPKVMEFRVDLRPLEKIAAKVHERLHHKMVAAKGGPVVGFSFGKAWRGIKKTAKKIGKSKLVKAIGKATKAVVKSKVLGSALAGLAVVFPPAGVPALAAYGAANAALVAVEKGKKLIDGASKIKETIEAGASEAKAVVNYKAKATNQAKSLVSAAQNIKPPTAAIQKALSTATNMQSRALQVAKAAQTAGTAQAKATANKQLAAANAKKTQVVSAAKKTVAAVKAKKQQAAAAAKNIAVNIKQVQQQTTPMLSRAAALKKKMADPIVRARMLTIKNQADSAKKALQDIADKGRFGSASEKLDAQKSRAIFNLTAQNQARIKAIAEQNAGGLPSMLIDSKGRITPGRYRVTTQAAAAGKADVLYLGKGKAQAGRFARVAGVPGIGADPLVYVKTPQNDYVRMRASTAAKWPRMSRRAQTAYLGRTGRATPPCPPSVAGLPDAFIGNGEPIAGHPPNYYRYIRMPNGRHLHLARRTVNTWNNMTRSQQLSYLSRVARKVEREGPCIQGRPPLKPREKVWVEWLAQQRAKGRIGGDIPGEVVGACMRVPIVKTPALSIGCDCEGTQF